MGYLTPEIRQKCEAQRTKVMIVWGDSSKQSEVLPSRKLYKHRWFTCKLTQHATPIAKFHASFNTNVVLTGEPAYSKNTILAAPPRHHRNTAKTPQKHNQNMSKTPKTSPNIVKTLRTHHQSATKTPTTTETQLRDHQDTSTNSKKDLRRFFSQRVAASRHLFPSMFSRMTIITTPLLQQQQHPPPTTTTTTRSSSSSSPWSQHHHHHNTITIIIIIIVVVVVVIIIIVFFFCFFFSYSSYSSFSLAIPVSSSSIKIKNYPQHPHFSDFNLCAMQVDMLFFNTSTKWHSRCRYVSYWRRCLGASA